MNEFKSFWHFLIFVMLMLKSNLAWWVVELRKTNCLCMSFSIWLRWFDLSPKRWDHRDITRPPTPQRTLWSAKLCCSAFCFVYPASNPAAWWEKFWMSLDLFQQQFIIYTIFSLKMQQIRQRRSFLVHLRYRTISMDIAHQNLRNIIFCDLLRKEEEENAATRQGLEPRSSGSVDHGSALKYQKLLFWVSQLKVAKNVSTLGREFHLFKAERAAISANQSFVISQEFLMLTSGFLLSRRISVLRLFQISDKNLEIW